jgi:amino acid adenylation domain-containing protein
MTSGCLFRWVEAGAAQGGARKVAVLAGNGQQRLTFSELIHGARGIAASLQARSVGRGDRVAVWMDKSPRSVQVLLGAMAAGAAYLPLDPRSPPSRCALILNDARPKALFVDGPRAAMALTLAREVDGGIPTLVRDAPPEVTDGATLLSDVLRTPHRPLPPADPDALAYILYTSGSTGTPKGVMHTHRSALAFTEWVVRTFDVTSDDVFTSHAPFHFDLSISDLYASLGRGARVHLISQVEAMIPQWLVRKLAEWEVTVWYSVPSALVSMLEKGGLAQARLPRLRTVLFAGEVFPPAQLRRLREVLPAVELANLYGPTETNVCTWHRVPSGLPSEEQPLPIGIGCDHMQSFAVDDEGRQIGVGEVGTLWAAGPNLMAGYFRPGGERGAGLAPDPRGGDAVCYDTGDRVRLRTDGGFDFLGRRDHQIKTRGYRVELGEIEAAALRDPRISEAVACALPDPAVGHRIAMAVVPREGKHLTVTEVRNACADKLPGYMVPERILVRDALPRTSTGKADRNQLRALLDTDTVEEGQGE